MKLLTEQQVNRLIELAKCGLSHNYQNEFHYKEQHQEFEEIVEVVKEYPQIKEKYDQLKQLVEKGIPEDCVLGCNEVKFCSYRNGEGNQCKHCLDI